MPTTKKSSVKSAKPAPTTTAPKKAPAKAVTKTAANEEIVPTLDLTKKYRSHKGDTGSTDIQVIGLTDKMSQLTAHLSTHAKDHDSRRGLLMMVGKRRRLLNYLKRQDDATYLKLVADLGLRK